jgi:hypothetical protein
MIWVNVDQELPPNKTRCLAYCEIGDPSAKWCGVVDVFYSRNKGWIRCEGSHDINVNVTYWMPFPEGPE